MKHLKKRLKPRCSFEGCTRRSKQTHECLTCIRLHEEGELKEEKPMVVHSCWRHTGQVIEELKRHALIKHPSNIVRATVAALKGEDVF